VAAAFHHSHSADLVEFNGLKTQIDDRQGCTGHVITRPQLVLEVSTFPDANESSCFCSDIAVYP
jgi:hypothetical protein